ncbi:MAG: cytochrome c oxidase subunit 3, partial [Gammaproteobacteria bacterium]|nr:cytochrome c oxidase subunit 3 [Gammaproteobacteria bacterium]
MAEVAVARPQSLPVGPVGRRGLGWWGVATLIASEGALFAYLLFAYYYLGAAAGPGWVLEPHPPLHLALPNTLLLLASSLVAWWAEHGVLQRARGQALLGFALTFIMGTVFAAVQFYEWHAKPFRLGDSSYASLYFATTGFHMAHVLVGVAVLGVILLWTALDYFSPRRRLS